MLKGNHRQASYQMAPVSMTLSGTWHGFQCCNILWNQISQKWCTMET